MRIFLFVTNLLILALMTSCNSITEKELKHRLEQNLEIYCSAQKNFECQKMINYYPQSLYESIEEKKAFEDRCKNVSEQFFKNGMFFKDVYYLEPSKFKQSGNYIHSIVPMRAIIYTPKNIETWKTFLYCLSVNHGQEWIIMDYEEIKTIYPDFKYEFHPDSESEVIEDSCKFITLNLLGEEVCLDRFIDSGEYEYLVMNNDKRYVYKLVKRDKSMYFNAEQIKQIELAISRWKSGIKTQFKFPEIKDDNIVYVESTINILTLDDIYGIPFSYVSSTNMINDTLLGNFRNGEFDILSSPPKLLK